MISAPEKSIVMDHNGWVGYKCALRRIGGLLLGVHSIFNPRYTALRHCLFLGACFCPCNPNRWPSAAPVPACEDNYAPCSELIPTGKTAPGIAAPQPVSARARPAPLAAPGLIAGRVDSQPVLCFVLRKRHVYQMLGVCG